VPPTGPGSAALQQALADVQKALTDAREALRVGDIGAWFAAQQRLQRAAEAAVRAQQQTTPTPSPTPRR
jgi:hypothetical protein